MIVLHDLDNNPIYIDNFLDPIVGVCTGVDEDTNEMHTSVLTLHYNYTVLETPSQVLSIMNLPIRRQN